MMTILLATALTTAPAASDFDIRAALALSMAYQNVPTPVPAPTPKPKAPCSALCVCGCNETGICDCGKVPTAKATELAGGPSVIRCEGGQCYRVPARSVWTPAPQSYPVYRNYQHMPLPAPFSQPTYYPSYRFIQPVPQYQYQTYRSWPG